MTNAVRTPRYSGPGRTGMCVCGHRWDEHHLMMVMRQEYLDETGEAYVPGACEAHGFNELEGLMRDGDSEEWVEHCFRYRDTGAAEDAL